MRIRMEMRDGLVALGCGGDRVRFAKLCPLAFAPSGDGMAEIGAGWVPVWVVRAFTFLFSFFVKEGLWLL